MKNTSTPSFAAVSFASAAFLLGCLSVPWCDFATLTSTVVDSAGSLLAETRLGFGLWRYQTYALRDGGLYIESSCSGYDSSLVEIDSAWKAARAFGILALVIGGVNVLHSYWQACRSNENKLSGATQAQISGAIFIVASFYQGLTLFFLRSYVCTSGGENKFQEQLGVFLQPAEIIYDETCTLSTGANMGIASTICWFAAGMFSCIANTQKERDASQHNHVVEDEATPNCNEEIDDAEKSTDSADTANLCGKKYVCDGADSGEQKTQSKTTELERQIQQIKTTLAK
mmetsp:Transcript_28271/g.60246  ORF Transcript_28271/g.60246 Transcript_28271/m.60246 type:complete len:286 (+) Transcript_28271:85-942(+)|eukprot:CAMPEP_0172323432 /NCGR_PEP_ID=MMETSP1058-20130122/48734_1 /TAXON_ID=83371 /ORGANISM="Detonula confervacea, Strain CCMP 353" /LENGTH=285 /DNA_ID=CAMNT_0013039427 /DNA_START=71 /DNA_END=928 /DNA_ORIENTATION=+